MKCAWKEFISLLPPWMRPEVDKLGRDCLQELRLRIGLFPELITSKGSLTIPQRASRDDLNFCINSASRYSPWTAGSMKHGYLTAPGGHRIGVCGKAVETDDRIQRIQVPTSLCIRVSRDFPGIAAQADSNDSSVLILGRPGAGKTTLLRDLIRRRSDAGTGSIAVVDEKEEIFPSIRGEQCFPAGRRTDIISGCNKKEGIEAVLRNMGPGTIAVDEVTAESDCEALLKAAWCGVKLIATAHAGTKEDLWRRSVYKPIVDLNVFDTLMILREDKSWYMERLTV